MSEVYDWYGSKPTTTVINAPTLEDFRQLPKTGGDMTMCDVCTDHKKQKRCTHYALATKDNSRCRHLRFDRYCTHV